MIFFLTSVNNFQKLICTTLDAQAEAALVRGDPSTAEQLWRLSTVEVQPGLGNSQSFACLHRKIGAALEAQGRTTQAEEFYRKNLLLEQQLGDDEQIIISLAFLGTFLRKQRRFAEAEHLIKQALTRSQKVHGTEGFDTNIYEHSLALIYVEQGHYQQAEDLYSEVIQRRTKLLGHADSRLPIMMLGLTRVYQHQRRYAEAESLLEQALRSCSAGTPSCKVAGEISQRLESIKSEQAATGQQ